MTEKIYEIRLRYFADLTPQAQEEVEKHLASKSKTYRKNWKGYCKIVYATNNSPQYIKGVYPIDGTIQDEWKKVEKMIKDSTKPQKTSPQLLTNTNESQISSSQICRHCNQPIQQNKVGHEKGDFELFWYHKDTLKRVCAGKGIGNIVLAEPQTICKKCGKDYEIYGSNGICDDCNTIVFGGKKPQDSPQGFSYACGHTSNAIIMNDTPLSMSAYLTWSTNEGRERTECFDCYLKRTEAEPQKSEQK